MSALVERNGLRATARMANVSSNTVNKLLLELGTACASSQGEAIRNVPSNCIHCDEILSFVYAKAKKVPEEE